MPSNYWMEVIEERGKALFSGLSLEQRGGSVLNPQNAVLKSLIFDLKGGLWGQNFTICFIDMGVECEARQQAGGRYNQWAHCVAPLLP